MSYKCAICTQVVPSGVVQRRHLVKRPNGQIERELPVCSDCAAGLRSGYTLGEMAQMCGPKNVTMPTAVAKSVMPVQPSATLAAPPVRVVRR